jgi:hypothetical protein
MGFDPDNVGYLSHCVQLGLGCMEEEQADVVGNVTPKTVMRSFAPHPRHQAQRRWQCSNAGELLQHDVLTEVVRRR